jgi:hypothetical protein
MPTASKTPLTDEFVSYLERQGFDLAHDPEGR